MKDLGVMIIENDVPMPAKVLIGWPHESMAVGQSFFVANRTMVNVSNANQRFRKKIGWKFTARKVDGGIRVWRIE